MFGELTALDGGERSASAQAVARTVLISVARNSLLDVIGRDSSTPHRKALARSTTRSDDGHPVRPVVVDPTPGSSAS